MSRPGAADVELRADVGSATVKILRRLAALEESDKKTTARLSLVHELVDAVEEDGRDRTKLLRDEVRRLQEQVDALVAEIREREEVRP